MAHKCNRLKLDWTLNYKDERVRFAHEYIDSFPFQLTPDELDMIGKYILWGKTHETGLNGRQEGLELETTNGTWDTHAPESLDALLEAPTFTESMIRQPGAPLYKVPKLNFSRAEARAKAPAYLRPELESLWRTIDETELVINFYELEHGKRKNPIRESLLSAFTQEELDSLREQSTHLNSYQYLCKKHELVELRRQQYTYKDCYAPTITISTTSAYSAPDPVVWDADIDILPLGLPYNTELHKLLFRSDRFPEPNDIPTHLYSALNELIWKEHNTRNQFDFTDPKQLAVLADYKLLCAASHNPDDLYSTLPELLKLFDIYVNLTDLKPFQQTLLDLKLQHKTNKEISDTIYELHGKRYTLNYISTLYHQSILGAIANTAARHREVVENLFFPENFKTCIDCGKTLLRDSENFTRKAKVKDGFDCRCKACAKIMRDKRRNAHE